MKQKFDSLCDFLFSTDWNAHFTMTFTEVCHRFDLDPSIVDNYLYGILGMSGDEIMEQYRNGPMAISGKTLQI